MFQKENIKLKLFDISSFARFKSWILKSIPLNKDRDLKYRDYMIILEHIEEYIKSNNFKYNRVTWKYYIQNIKSSIEKLKSLEEKSE